MKKLKVLNVLSLIFNLLIAALTVLAVTEAVKNGVWDGETTVRGGEVFKLFNVDINVFLATSALLIVVTDIVSIATGIEKKIKFFTAFKFITTASSLLAMLSAVCFFGFVTGFNRIFGGTNIIFNLVNPILALISYCLFESIDRFDPKKFYTGVFPPFIYGLVYLYMNVVIKLWNDFYGLRGGNGVVLFIVFIVISLIISLVITCLHESFKRIFDPDTAFVYLGENNKDKKEVVTDETRK